MNNIDYVLTLRALRRLVDEQTKDEGLWFEAKTASEAYLQKELYRLHHMIEEPYIISTTNSIEYHWAQNNRLGRSHGPYESYEEAWASVLGKGKYSAERRQVYEDSGWVVVKTGSFG